MSLTAASRYLILSVALGLGSACAGNPPPDRLYVIDRPPVARREFIPVVPGPRYVWVPGRWNRAPRGWAWTPGRYMLPPGRYHAWVPGSWHQGRRGWYYVDGRWR
jgi:WXXGXW repeat (2 copies)